MLGEIKRTILNVDLKKYRRQTQYCVIDLKMELLVDIVNDFKLETIFAKISILDVSQVLSMSLTTINRKFFTNYKRAISRFFRTVTLTTQPGIYLLRANNKNTKNIRA